MSICLQLVTRKLRSVVIHGFVSTTSTHVSVQYPHQNDVLLASEYTCRVNRLSAVNLSIHDVSIYIDNYFFKHTNQLYTVLDCTPTTRSFGGCRKSAEEVAQASFT